MMKKVVLWVILVFFAMIFWFVATHNLDNLHNASMFYNDANMEHCNNCYDLRDFNDCSAVRLCPDFRSIYLNSNIILTVSFFTLIFVIGSMGIALWKKSRS